MSNTTETIVNKTASLAREYMEECQWSLNGIEAALNLMYRGLADKPENEEAIAAVGMLREYFRSTVEKVRQISLQFEKQLQA